jgi:outer membrane protein W
MGISSVGKQSKGTIPAITDDQRISGRNICMRVEILGAKLAIPVSRESRMSFPSYLKPGREGVREEGLPAVACPDHRFMARDVLEFGISGAARSAEQTSRVEQGCSYGTSQYRIQNANTGGVMKKFSLIIVGIVLATVPAAAQNVDLGLWATNLSISDSTLEGTNDVRLRFDENWGFGVTADVRWGRWLSTEIGLYDLSADGVLAIGGFLEENIDMGRLRMMPVTLTVRAHFGGARFDGYVGAGIAYVMIDDLESRDMELIGTGVIEIDDETTWLANAGFSFRVTRGMALGIDAKWISLTADTTSNLGERVEFDLDPLLISAGIIFRF